MTTEFESLTTRRRHFESPRTIAYPHIHLPKAFSHTANAVSLEDECTPGSRAWLATTESPFCVWLEAEEYRATLLLRADDEILALFDVHAAPDPGISWCVALMSDQPSLYANSELSVR